MEIWRGVEGFTGYEVSNLGRVRSNLVYRGDPGPRVLQPLDNGNGYKQVSLRSDGKTYKRYVHRLVAMAFLPKPSGTVEVCHGPGGQHDNSAGNLYWASHSQNCDDRTKYGGQNTSDLTEDDVRKIRALLESDTQENIGHMFGISQTTVSAIKLRKTWAWVN